MKKWLYEIELTGDVVNMVPLNVKYKQALIEAASDGQLWDLWFTSVPNADNIEQYITTALTDQFEGRSLPFVVIDKKTNQVIGCTRFCNAFNNNRLEIGYTWYAQSHQRSAVNTECKYLLLSHAFERLNCIAVEFRTHWHNHNSRAAILRLGAKQDGVLRHHMIDDKGIIRDTVVFSILKQEWPAVKQSLAYKLKQD